MHSNDNYQFRPEFRPERTPLEECDRILSESRAMLVDYAFAHWAPGRKFSIRRTVIDPGREQGKTLMQGAALTEEEARAAVGECLREGRCFYPHEDDCGEAVYNREVKNNSKNGHVKRSLPPLGRLP